MTAPLPPLPVEEEFYHEAPSGYTPEQMQAYAKLAVRQALERTVENVRNLSVAGGPTQLRQAALDAIRAMMKEYK